MKLLTVETFPFWQFNKPKWIEFLNKKKLKLNFFFILSIGADDDDTIVKSFDAFENKGKIDADLWVVKFSLEL